MGSRRHNILQVWSKDLIMTTPFAFRPSLINLPNLAKVIVGGDFNVSINHSKDTLGYCNITMSRARRVIVNANNMAIILTLLGKSTKTKKNICTCSRFVGVKVSG